MLVLGVETSCDETAVAVVRDGKEVLSNVVFSQIDIHKEFGGVVPEVASRHHVQKITYVLEQALREAKVVASDLDLVAVTTRPGLIGSLLVGINAARAFAVANELPIVEVDHIHGHIYANYIERDFQFPVLALVVSGGHTELILMKDHYEFQLLGQTFDDAIGEAYDKVGRVMGLEYPGGIRVDNLAQTGKHSYRLPKTYLDKSEFNFSFSGIKSAVINLINQANMKHEEIRKEDLATTFQETVVQILVDKTVQAAQTFHAKHVVVAGGVAANKGLRREMKSAIDALEGVELTFPSMRFCTDNAAMIAVSGYFKYTLGK